MNTMRPESQARFEVDIHADRKMDAFKNSSDRSDIRRIYFDECGLSDEIDGKQ
jgi:hypothetical protein